MSSKGFTVTKKYKSDVPYDDMPKYMTTAWRAEFTHTPKRAQGSARSARTLGVNSEMDGLPIPKGEVSHACGHNLIAVGGVGIALAVRKALEVHDVAGTVVLLGTPAEEGGRGKVRLFEAGGYKGIDACIMWVATYTVPSCSACDAAVVGVILDQVLSIASSMEAVSQFKWSGFPITVNRRSSTITLQTDSY